LMAHFEANLHCVGNFEDSFLEFGILFKFQIFIPSEILRNSLEF
jgi:hypothetical protein